MSQYLLQRRAKMMGQEIAEVAKKPTKIAYLSKKRQKLQPKYRKIVFEMAKKSNECEVKAEGCTGIMSGCHHVIKRSETNLIDRSNLKRCCTPCQNYLELNDAWARKNGFVKSKFKPTN